MAKKRRVRNEQDAKRCLEAARAAGQGRSEWARQHGVDGRSLYSWEKKLAPDESEQRERQGGLVELIPGSPQVAGYVVRYGQFAVEVDEHFDEETLGRLLKVVAAC